MQAVRVVSGIILPSWSSVHPSFTPPFIPPPASSLHTQGQRRFPVTLHPSPRSPLLPNPPSLPAQIRLAINPYPPRHPICRWRAELHVTWRAEGYVSRQCASTDSERKARVAPSRTLDPPQFFLVRWQENWCVKMCIGRRANIHAKQRNCI